MKHIKRMVVPALIIAILVLASSCFGVTMDIALNQNGTGTISLEYRISKELDSLGKLDGNERWNTVPVGKADFERSLSRLPEIKLLSFSSTEDAKDVIVSTKIAFSNINGLLAFLDASGLRSSFAGDTSSGSLSLTLSDGAKDGTKIDNINLSKLIEEAAVSYSVGVGMSLPKEGSLAILDKAGTTIETQKVGKKLSRSFPLGEVLSSESGIKLIFNW